MHPAACLEQQKPELATARCFCPAKQYNSPVHNGMPVHVAAFCAAHMFLERLIIFESRSSTDLRLIYVFRVLHHRRYGSRQTNEVAAIAVIGICKTSVNIQIELSSSTVFLNWWGAFS
jgi:hypothetical protein